MESHRYPMNEQLLLEDALFTQNALTNLYSRYANECAGAVVHSEMLGLLQEEHEIQSAIVQELHKRGWYPTKPADSSIMQEAVHSISRLDEEKAK